MKSPERYIKRNEEIIFQNTSFDEFKGRDDLRENIMDFPGTAHEKLIKLAEML